MPVLYDVLGRALLLKGDYAESEHFFSKALGCSQFKDNHHPEETLTILHNLVALLILRCRYSEAEKSCLLGIQKATESFGEDHVEVSEFKMLMARIYVEKSRYEEALVLLSEARSKIIQSYGEKHTKSLVVVSDSLLVLYRQRKFKDVFARSNVLAQANEIFDPSHPTILRIRSLQGTVLNDLQRYHEALQVHDEVLTCRRQRLGEKHPDTILSMHQLAVSHMRLDHLETVESLLTSALAGAKEVLTLDHTLTIFIMHDKAAILHKRGKIEEAIAQERQCLDIVTKDRMYRKYLVRDVTAFLGYYLCEFGRYEEALEYFRNSEQIFQSYITESDPAIAHTRVKIAEVLEKLGNNVESEKVLRDTLRDLETSLGPDESYTLDYVEWLADFLRRNSRFEEAEPFYQTLYEAYSEQSGAEDARVLKILTTLSSTLRSANKLALAEATGRKVLEARQRAFPEDIVNICLNLNDLAMVLYDLKRYDEAVDLLREAIEKRSKAQGLNCEETRFNKMNLMSILVAQKDWSAADQLFSSVLDGRSEEYGPNDLRCLSTWARAFEDWLRHERYDKILDTSERVIDQHVAVLGEGNEQTLHVIAAAALQSGLQDEAEKLFDRVYQPCETPLSLYSPKNTFCFKYANLLSARNKAQKMESFAQDFVRECAGTPRKGQRRYLVSQDDPCNGLSRTTSTRQNGTNLP